MIGREDGTYTAKAVEVSLGKSKNGFPQVVIRFSIRFGGETEWFNWYGSLKEGKAKDITLTAIETAGVQHIFTSDYDGAVTSVNNAPEVDIVLETQEWQGRPIQKITWINEKGGSSFKGELSKEDGIAIMKGANIFDELQARKTNTAKQEPLSF